MKPSELNKRIAASGDEDARAAKAEIITRVGRKIRRLRDSGKLTGQAFVDFRNQLYGMPEDDREEHVDRTLRQHGLTDAE